ncbi:hypothetical protein, partial [Cellulomonas cellasea]
FGGQPGLGAQHGFGAQPGFGATPGQPGAWQGGPAAFGSGAPRPYGPGPKPTNSLATGALVVSVAVVVVAFATGIAYAFVLAVILSVKALQRANEIAREGYGAVGRARAVVALVLSALVVLDVVLSAVFLRGV